MCGTLEAPLRAQENGKERDALLALSREVKGKELLESAVYLRALPDPKLPAAPQGIPFGRGGGQPHPHHVDPF
ncbi:MAG: hypothetical protein QXK27_04740 [Candidatus Hadarchaeales archaeon]